MIAALLGAAIGGFATYEVNRQSENRADKRAAAADTAAARGIARVLQAHYDSASVVVATMTDSGSYFVARPLSDELAYEDRKALAAHLSPEAWDAIAQADADLVSLVYLIGNMAPYEQDDMSAADRRNLDAIIRHLQRAQDVLE